MNSPSSRDFRYPVAILFCLAFLLFTRFAELAHKPYHHDESLYATEAWRYATQGLYKFNPMMHGPFLFHVHAALFKIFPINDFTGRLPVALAGTFLALFAFSFVPRAGWLSAVVWLSLVSFSPVFCYFSRFLGMDVLMAFLATGFFFFSLRSWEKRSATSLYWAAAFFIFMVCTKLNWLFYFFSFGTFFLAWPLWAENGYRPAFRDGIASAKEFARGFKYHWIAVAAILVAVYCALNSSLGKHKGAILDALYREMIPYWVGQHKIERVGGPFHYYFPFFAVYELPLILGTLWAVLHILRISKPLRKSTVRWCLGCLALWGILSLAWDSVGTPFNAALHFKAPFQPPLLVLEIGLWLLLMKFHLRAGEIFAAFSAHWGVSSLVLYSMAGEKVPWLAVHVLLPWFFYFAIVLPPLAMDWMSYRLSRLALGIIIILVFSWQGVVTVRSSLDLSANPREMLVYTHTSWDTLELVERLQHIAGFTKEGLNLAVQVTGDGVWPLQWYLRDYTRWYWVKIDPLQSPRIAVDDWEKRDEIQALLGPNYAMERVKLREWWVPETKEAGLSDYLKYYFTRKIFSPIGSTDMAVFIRGDILNEWRQFVPDRKLLPSN